MTERELPLDQAALDVLSVQAPDAARVLRDSKTASFLLGQFSNRFYLRFPGVSWHSSESFSCHVDHDDALLIFDGKYEDVFGGGQ